MTIVIHCSHNGNFKYKVEELFAVTTSNNSSATPKYVHKPTLVITESADGQVPNNAIDW